MLPVLRGGRSASPYTVPNQACFTSATDRFHYPYNGEMIWRPMGSGRQLASVTDSTTVDLRKGAGNFVINWSNNYRYEWGRSVASDPLVHITVEAGYGGDNLPADVRMPALWPQYGSNGDRPCFIYDTTTGIGRAFYRLERLTNTTAQAAGMYIPDLNGKGYGLPRSHNGATCIHTNAMYLKGWEWMPTLAPPVQHALALILGANANLQQLTNAIAWPAFTKDGFMNASYPYQGTIPYGALITIPTISEGGPTAASLGLTDPRAIRLFECVRDYGLYACETGAQMQFRANKLADGSDPGFTSAVIAILEAAMDAMNPWLRMVTNNAQAQTCSGGGTPIADNCAYDKL